MKLKQLFGALALVAILAVVVIVAASAFTGGSTHSSKPAPAKHLTGKQVTRVFVSSLGQALAQDGSGITLVSAGCIPAPKADHFECLVLLQKGTTQACGMMAFTMKTDKKPTGITTQRLTLPTCAHAPGYTG